MRMVLVLLLVAVAASSAGAAPVVVGQSAGAATAVDEAAQAVACARYGWHGWGAYPGCFGPGYLAAVPYYAAPPAYVAPEGYMPLRYCRVAGAWRPC